LRGHYRRHDIDAKELTCEGARREIIPMVIFTTEARQPDRCMLFK